MHVSTLDVAALTFRFFCRYDLPTRNFGVSDNEACI